MYTLSSNSVVRVQEGLRVMTSGQTLLPEIRGNGGCILPRWNMTGVGRVVSAEDLEIAVVTAPGYPTSRWIGLVLWDGSMTGPVEGGLGRRPVIAGAEGRIREDGVLVYCYPTEDPQNVVRNPHARDLGIQPLGVYAMGFRTWTWNVAGWKKLSEFNTDMILYFELSALSNIRVMRMQTGERRRWESWVGQRICHDPIVDVLYKLRVVGVMRMSREGCFRGNGSEELLKWGLVVMGGGR